MLIIKSPPCWCRPPWPCPQHRRPCSPEPEERFLTCRDLDEDVGDVDGDGEGDHGCVRIVSGMVTMVVVTSMVTNMVTRTITRLVMVTPLQTRARPPWPCPWSRRPARRTRRSCLLVWQLREIYNATVDIFVGIKQGNFDTNNGILYTWHRRALRLCRHSAPVSCSPR